MIIYGYFFLYLNGNICCGYSLEAPRLNEALLMSTHNICFRSDIRKNIHRNKTIFPKLSSNTSS